MINKRIAGIFIVLLAIFLVACKSIKPDIPAQPPEHHTGTGLKMPQSLLTAVAPALVETRYCGKTERDAKVVAAFRRIHPCPATGLTTGACPYWQIDHVIPIDNGGCDSVNNMQWLPVWLKTCAAHCKDRFERKIYCKPLAEGGTGCENSVIQPKE